MEDRNRHKWAGDPEKYKALAQDMFGALKMSDADQSFLDLGCGSGWMMHLAIKAGVKFVRGCDSECDPFTVQCQEILNIDHLVAQHFIAPDDEYFERYYQRWDMIAATWICFGKSWTREEWTVFLRRMIDHLTLTGRAVLRFNDHHGVPLAMEVACLMGFVRSSDDEWLFTYSS